MRKYLGALSLAVAAITSAVTAHAAKEDWENDPEVVYGNIIHSSCTKPTVDKPAETATFDIEFIRTKADWDKIPDADKPKTWETMNAIAKETLDKEWRAAIAGFTAQEIDERDDNYRTIASHVMTLIGDRVKERTGVEMLVGIDVGPNFKKGCTPP